MQKNTVCPDAGEQSARPAGRPRDEAVHRAILDSAYAILVEGGLSQFSIDSVASRAKVARTTIYRRWPDKMQLINDCFLAAFEATLDFPMTASPRDDFHTLITSLAKTLSGPNGRIAASVLAQAQSDKKTQVMFQKEFSAPLRRQSTALLQAGIQKKAFREDLDIPCVLDAAVGAVYWRLLCGQTLSPSWARELANTLLCGCY